MNTSRFAAALPFLLLLAAARAQAPATLPADVRSAIDRAKEKLTNAPLEPRSTLATRPGAWAATTVTGGGKLAILNATETRPTQGAGQIALMLELTNPDFGPLVSVRKISITKAIDDREVNLVPLPSVATGPATAGNSGLLAMLNASSPPPAGAPAGRGGGPGGVGRGGGAAVVPPGTLRGTALLTAARRDATTIRSVEGELEIFAPSAANGSIIAFKNFGGQFGQALSTPILTREGIEVLPVDPATMAALGERTYTAPRSGQLAPLALTGPALFVKDPASRIAGIFIQDANGRALPISAATLRTTTDGGYLFDLRPAQPLPADAQIVIHVAVAEAIQMVPFRFENVLLP